MSRRKAVDGDFASEPPKSKRRKLEGPANATEVIGQSTTEPNCFDGLTDDCADLVLQSVVCDDILAVVPLCRVCKRFERSIVSKIGLFGDEMIVGGYTFRFAGYDFSNTRRDDSSFLLTHFLKGLGRFLKSKLASCTDDTISKANQELSTLFSAKLAWYGNVSTLFSGLYGIIDQSVNLQSGLKMYEWYSKNGRLLFYDEEKKKTGPEYKNFISPLLACALEDSTAKEFDVLRWKGLLEKFKFRSALRPSLEFYSESCFLVVANVLCYKKRWEEVQSLVETRSRIVQRTAGFKIERGENERDMALSRIVFSCTIGLQEKIVSSLKKYSGLRGYSFNEYYVMMGALKFGCPKAVSLALKLFRGNAKMSPEYYFYVIRYNPNFESICSGMVDDIPEFKTPDDCPPGEVLQRAINDTYRNQIKWAYVLIQFLKKLPVPDGMLGKNAYERMDDLLSCKRYPPSGHLGRDFKFAFKSCNVRTELNSELNNYESKGWVYDVVDKVKINDVT
jgi:hypothetical protein